MTLRAGTGPRRFARPSARPLAAIASKSDQEIPGQRRATKDGCAAAPAASAVATPTSTGQMEKCSQARPAQSQWASGGAERRGRSQVVLGRPGTANVTARWCRPSARAGGRRWHLLCARQVHRDQCRHESRIARKAGRHAPASAPSASVRVPVGGAPAADEQRERTSGRLLRSRSSSVACRSGGGRAVEPEATRRWSRASQQPRRSR
jgi:hypothetical protein